MDTFASTPAHINTIPQLLDFYDALQAVAAGARITRLDWADETCYGVLRAGIVHLHKPDGYYTWTISDGDLAAEDWYVLP